MGTVGLSFGSPTSGAGFDVSSTVSAIMANLQNVETPWKTQISSIHSQDAVFSSLGTLLSNLSNDMSNLSSATGVLTEKTGSSSNTNVLEITGATSASVAGNHSIVVSQLATNASGYLSEVPSSSTALSGSIVIQVGTAQAQTVTLGSTNNTLTGLASAINAAGIGVTAAVLTDSTGSRLSIVSSTSGTGGQLTINSALKLASGSATAMTYTSSSSSVGILGSVGSLTDTLAGSVVVQVGSTTTTIALDSTNDTLSGLMSTINGDSLGVQASIITNTDGTHSLQLSGSNGASVSATSGLTDTTNGLGYTSVVQGQNASITVDGVGLQPTSNAVTNLIPGVTFQLLSASTTPVQVVIGNYNSGVESTVNSLVTDYNSLVSAINAQEGVDSAGNNMPLYGSPTLSMLQQDILGAINTANTGGYLDAISSATGTTLSGSIVLQVGTASAQTITIDSSNNTLSGLASSINAEDLGVTAAVVTTNGMSTLTFTNTGLEGTKLSVSSALNVTTPTSLYFADGGYTMSTADSSSVSVNNASDVLTGSLVLQVGSSSAYTVNMSSSLNSLAGLASAINSASIGVSASVTDGKLTLTSGTNGSDGALTVASYLTDQTHTTTTAMTYTNSGDISSLTTLGLSVNADGTLSLDYNTLDSVLNSDFSSVQDLFQNANSWGTNFKALLNNIGSSSSNGMISLALASNSSIEKTLTADISREDSLISAESKSLTAQLISANEIMQALPTQLSGVNELYSAITGYNQSGS